MTEIKPKNGPRQIIDNALRAVKGDSIQSLVEDFTAEMTTVAEGLCEDQAKLRGRMTDLENAQDRDRQRLESEVASLEQEGAESTRELREQIRQLTARLDALEHQDEKKQKQRQKKKWLGEGWIGQVIILAAIVCGAWVIVTVLNLFH